MDIAYTVDHDVCSEPFPCTAHSKDEPAGAFQTAISTSVELPDLPSLKKPTEHKSQFTADNLSAIYRLSIEY